MVHPFHNKRIKIALKMGSRRKNSGKAEVHTLTTSAATNAAGQTPFEFWVTEHVVKTFGATSEGAAFFAAADATALPAGWFTNIMNWVLTNFPTILADIISVLKLFNIPVAAIMAAIEDEDMEALFAALDDAFTTLEVKLAA